jgi:predicted AAA+ superfamily ATPase
MSVSEMLKAAMPSKDLLQELLDVVLGEASRQHRSPRLSASLAERLFVSMGGPVSFHALSKIIDAGTHPILRQYVEILEACFSIVVIEKLNPQTKTGVLRKEKKIYFMDPMVMAALVSWSRYGEVKTDFLEREFTDSERVGAWIEMLVSSELAKRESRIFYDNRKGREIDFAYLEKGSDQIHYLEVKKSKPHPAELAHMEGLKNAECLFFEDKSKHEAKAAPLPSLPTFHFLAERLLEWNRTS